MTQKHVLNVLKVAGLAFMATMATIASNAGADCSRAAADKKDPCCFDPIDRHQGRGWLGIEKQIQADGTYTVTTVHPDSPAAVADLRVGDIIKRIDGIRLTPGTAKEQLPSRSMIGRTVPIGVQRGTDHLILFARVIEIPAATIGSLREKDRERAH